MENVFLVLFFISGLVHLVASKKDDKALRAHSKGFILASLLAYYLCGADPVQWTIVLALIFSWFGDLFLILPGVKWFTVGGISFMISHFFFALSYSAHIDLTKVPVWLCAIVAVIYLFLVFIVFRGLKPYLSKKLFYPMYLYLLINGFMNFSAFLQLYSLPCLATVITFIGALLFFASDSILFYVRFNTNTRWKNHFPVMLTYIFAEFLIVQGLMMIN